MALVTGDYVLIKIGGSLGAREEIVVCMLEKGMGGEKEREKSI